MKKLLKRFITIILIAVMTVLFIACGDSAVESTKGGAKEAVSDVKKEDVTIEEQVIFEQKNVKVTVTGIDTKGIFGPELKVLIENSSEKNVIVQSSYTSVNGLMVEALLSSEVAAGKKSNDTMTFMNADLEISDIDVISEIETTINVIDADSWENIIKSEPITIKTSATENYVQKIDDSGVVAYEDENVKIVAKKVDSEDSFWGADVYLYMENNSDKNLTIQASDVSIDGFMVQPIFSSDIQVGKKAFDTLTFMESELEANNITEISTIELKFHIFNSDTWNTVVDTNAITLNFQ